MIILWKELIEISLSMNNRFKCFALLIFVCSAMLMGNCHAQFENMKFEYLTIDNGLSQSRVQCILRDRKGYLWMGTKNGLNKFDGQKNTVYKNNSLRANSISDNNIRCIYEDKSDNLWIGTTAGINLYDRRNDAFKRFLPSLNTSYPTKVFTVYDDIIYSIHEDLHGNIWCSTDNGFKKLNLEKNFFTGYNVPATKNYYASNVICSFLLDNEGSIWLGTEDENLWRFNPVTLQFDAFMDPMLKGTSGMFRVILQDKTGIIWLGIYGKGLISFDSKTEKFQYYNCDGDRKGTRGNLIKDLFLKDDYLYISVDLGGINRLDLKTMTFDYCFRAENEEESLKSDAVLTIFVDNEEILYAGTSVAGVSIHNPKKDRFATYRHSGNFENSLIYNAVFKFFEDSQGLIWIGTDGGGVSVFDPVRKTFKNFRHDPKDLGSLSRNAVLAITEDTNNDIWLGTWGGGLNRFERKTGRFYHYMPNPSDPFAISNPRVWDLYTDKKGKIWISYDYSGMDVFDIKQGVIKKYRNNASDSTLLCPLMINRFILQSDGKMGFAANKGYFTLDSITGMIKPVKYLEGYDVSDVCLDKNGTFWVATSANGIILANSAAAIEKHNESNGFLSNSISGFLEESKETMWILTSSGLAQYNSKTKKFRYFTDSDGLQGKQFTAYAHLKAKDGTFYIGGFNGFNVFHPEDIKENASIPPVYIDEFRIFNELVTPSSPNSPLEQVIAETKGIKLSYEQSEFSFGFTAINFTYPQNAKYAYKMKGYDENWNFTDASRRYVSYTNLDPGQYIFMVKATNNDGVWNETPTTIHITITPPFWKTLWFKLLTTLFFISLIVSIYRIRINQLKRQKRVLEQKVKERTTELQEVNVKLEENQEEILQQNESIMAQRDILELKNKELEGKNLEIIQITNQLHDADQLKIRFFTNISHDLRTPLTLILGYLESVFQGIGNNKILAERLSIITNNANRLLRLVNQLLDFQKIDAESLKLHCEYQDVVDVSRNIFDAFGLQAEKRKIAYSMQSGKKIFFTWFDPDMLDKILFNLLSNAFKFTPDGGKIMLELDFTNAEPHDEITSESLIIRVSDSGIGIQKQDLDKIFDRFYQADNSLSGKYEGSGIGLALIKHLVKIHHGTISVNSQAMKGSCFEVSLTIGKSLEYLMNEKMGSGLTIPYTDSHESIGDSIPDARVGTIEGSVILVVEDNDELRNFIREELKSKYKIIEAIDGQQGLEIAIREQPDLIISDVMMPFLDGFQMSEKLKLEWQTSHIPIIILTAKSDEESFYTGIEIGADAYIRKPFKMRHLLIQIENLLSNRRKLLAKFGNNSLIGSQKLTENSSDREWVKRLYLVLEEHLSDNNFGVETLAEAMNMSRSQLYKITLSVLKVTAGELIRDFRLKKAAEFLNDKRNSVSDVAFMVGFSDRPQFSRSFTNLFGLSPKQFQLKGKG
jgi:signal transduction histidine kinase/ligand-binding sensor domain-containing protein/CheY-like chemotaxis protein/AraC-like DNA-binding protein